MSIDKCKLMPFYLVKRRNMRCWLIILFAFCFVNGYAKEIDSLEYSDTYLGFLRKEWKKLPYKCKIINDGSEYVGDASVLFLPVDDDKKRKSFIRRNVKYVKLDDSYYLNCLGVECEGRKLGEGFVMLNSLGKDEYLLVMSDVRRGSSSYVAAAILGGVALTAITAASENLPHLGDNLYDKRRCYVYNALTNEAHLVNKMYMDNLSVDESICAEYKTIKRKYRYTPGIVVWYFMKLGLLKKAPVDVKVPKDIVPYQ